MSRLAEAKRAARADAAKGRRPLAQAIEGAPSRTTEGRR